MTRKHHRHGLGVARLAALLLSIGLLTDGCLLPSYELGESDAAVEVPACGVSTELPDSCGACVAEACCELAEQCADDASCVADAREPITPGAYYGESFEPLLACMQDNCNAACEVDWGCLDNYRDPLPEGPLALPITARDFLADGRPPIPQAQVRACPSIDPACELQETDGQEADDDGLAMLEVAGGFDGSFLVEHPDFVPAIIYWTRPFADEEPWNQYMLRPAVLDLLAASVSETIDEDRGHIIFRVHNCLPAPKYLEASPHADAEDVIVSAQPSEGASQAIYTDVNGSPSPTLDMTSPDALGGILNLKPGNVTVTATRGRDQTNVSRATVAIKAGHLTFVYLSPRPRP